LSTVADRPESAEEEPVGIAPLDPKVRHCEKESDQKERLQRDNVPVGELSWPQGNERQHDQTGKQAETDQTTFDPYFEHRVVRIQWFVSITGDTGIPAEPDAERV